MAASIPVERLDSWLGYRVRQTPHEPALTFNDTTWTYEKLWDAGARMAGTLYELGVRKGGRVAWFGHNDPAAYAAVIACSRLGAAFVPLNRRLSVPELTVNISMAGATVLLADPDHCQLSAQVSANLPGLSTFSTGVSAGERGASWMDHPPLAADVVVEVEADEPVIIMFTSGTEGLPKGVMLTHASVWWQGLGNVLSVGYTAADVVLVMSPLFHVSGLTAQAPAIWLVGGHVVLIRGFDPDLVFDVIPRHGVTFTGSVATLVEMLADHPRFDSADLSSMRGIGTGGAPIQDRILQRLAARSVAIWHQYGMTEIGGSIFSNHDDQAGDTLAVGRPLFGIDVCLVTDDGAHSFRPGESGQVAVKGPSLFRGYLINGVPTPRPVDSQGWFLTGDLARIDERGNVYLVARLGEIIKTGGEKVHPAEVERVLARHPSVFDVVVGPAPHEKWGETVIAVVVPRPGTVPTLAELRQFAEADLARFKLPTALHLAAEIPKTASGKKSRALAVQSYLKSESRIVDS